jgi:hypothetical protein
LNKLEALFPVPSERRMMFRFSKAIRVFLLRRRVSIRPVHPDRQPICAFRRIQLCRPELRNHEG